MTACEEDSIEFNRDVAYRLLEEHKHGDWRPCRARLDAIAYLNGEEQGDERRD